MPSVSSFSLASRRLGAPRTVSSECGMVLEAASAQAASLQEALEAAGLGDFKPWRRSGAMWPPTSLSAPTPPPVALTKGSAYGGCGAKLSCGQLSTILCGLPRLESPDLLVGIETIDDAGGLRVAPDIAIVHTVDFFPPIVDDPFSYGRIVAANALSDVYAMGGEALAGMNLVSYPMATYGKDVLKEILRGGLTALQEAGAVLVGGHTIEGQELLYGMAVTGRIHPDAIWRNAGARPGDLLVLTKPLGTGLVTTAAKAGLAAGMAEASGVVIEIDLGALPLLPGARAAAEMGLVPAASSQYHGTPPQVAQALASSSATF